MKRLVIGTAGHVDHGKTRLVQALTGVDTDRLEEEKRRGVTIDLGFAQRMLPGGTLADIVDVPGHAGYVKNMLAGAAALDLVWMVVAADEGVMPQTREHLDILTLLGVSLGVVVLTKCDLVDAETLALAQEDARDGLAGSFLADAPLVCVSARTGMGLDELIAVTARLAGALPERGGSRPARLWADRVFSLPGFGTVVTGALTEGALAAGDRLCLYPAGRPVKIRGLQSGGQPLESAREGCRIAVNLAGARQEEIRRGDVLAAPGSVCVTTRVNVRLSALASSPYPITHNSRLHLAVGTASTVCRVALPGGGELLPGRSSYAQLRLESPLAARPGDRFVVRFYSPVITVGGGVLLDPAPRRRQLDSAALERLQLYDGGSLDDRLLYEARHGLLTKAELEKRFYDRSAGALSEALERLTISGALQTVGGYLVTPGRLERLTAEIRESLTAFHAENPLADGISAARLRERFPQTFLDALAGRGIIRQAGPLVSLPEFTPEETALYAQLAGQILALYDESGFMPPAAEELPGLLNLPEEQARRMLALLERGGRLVRLNESLLLLARDWETAKSTVAALAATQGVTLAQLRDALGLSRKYAQAILEAMDRLGFTVREGDSRRLA